jgi:hypothetical protein
MPAMRRNERKGPGISIVVIEWSGIAVVLCASSGAMGAAGGAAARAHMQAVRKRRIAANAVTDRD